MAKRINVILTEATVRTLDRLARPTQRSRFIERAAQHYVATASPQAPQKRLNDLDLEIADDWFALDQAQWQRLDRQEQRQVKPVRSGAKSTSQRSIQR